MEVGDQQRSTPIVIDCAFDGCACNTLHFRKRGLPESC
jgi:hypothetical protein